VLDVDALPAVELELRPMLNWYKLIKPVLPQRSVTFAIQGTVH
jgi:hypothetical protein